VNNSELASTVAARTGLPASQVKVVIDAVVEEIAAQLEAGEDVSIAGFGKFCVSERAAREGRNPRPAR
jgi:DNA-binding protein HU-beta